MPIIASTARFDQAADSGRVDENLQGGRLAFKPTCSWNAIGAGSLLHTANSYAVGANVPGKPRCILPYAGAASSYRELCASIAADSYRGFSLT